jgi:sterol desaturase/sphingolipid hydroxylase (fatty acid hydroxylase superfamily)
MSGGGLGSGMLALQLAQLLCVLALCFYFRTARKYLGILNYAFHKLFHDNRWLYRHVHALHHAPHVDVGVLADQLHPVEMLVELAHTVAKLMFLPFSFSFLGLIVGDILYGFANLSTHEDWPWSVGADSGYLYHRLHHWYTHGFIQQYWDLVFNTYTPAQKEKHKAWISAISAAAAAPAGSDAQRAAQSKMNAMARPPTTLRDPFIDYTLDVALLHAVGCGVLALQIGALRGGG